MRTRDILNFKKIMGNSTPALSRNLENLQWRNIKALDGVMASKARAK